MQTMSGIRSDTSISALRDTKDRFQSVITDVTVRGDTYRGFKILRKSRSRFDRVGYEMLVTEELKPTSPHRPLKLQMKHGRANKRSRAIQR